MKFTRHPFRTQTITVTVRDDGTVGRLTRASGAALRGAAGLVTRGLGAIAVTGNRAAGTTTTMQVLPDSTLRGLAAASVGVGTGFYLARKPRLVVALGVVPALLAGAAILLRPIEPDHEPAAEGE
jgi:hypothetical protein